MNLLTDAWVPVRELGRFKQVPLAEVLCEDKDISLSLPRDDLEMAALQLLVSLTQVLWMPKDVSELRLRIKTPLSPEEYQSAIEEKKEWFDLEHPEYPFMQEKTTPQTAFASIQGIFAGMPDEKSTSSHALFVESSQISYACPSCITIAVFNRASCTPNYSGKHKGALRGGAPVTTLLLGNNLRENIWLNVMSSEFVKEIIPLDENADNLPVWVNPIKNKSTFGAQTIGLLRGLFWQPIHILFHNWEEGVCQLCRTKGKVHGDYLRASDFKYTLNGIWPHPHSPRVWDIKKGERDRDRFLSFTTTAPTWTRLNEMLLEKLDKKKGMQPAGVIRQYEKHLTDIPFFLAVGGYRNKQASILERRHEGFSFKQGWLNDKNRLTKFIERGLEIKTLLRKKTYGFGKSVGVEGVANETETKFFTATEMLVLSTLREMDWRESKAELLSFTEKASTAAVKVFDETTRPYSHDVRMIPHLVRSRNSLYRELRNLTIPTTT